MLLNYDGSQVG